MGVKRIEVAILSEDAEEDAIPILGSFVSMLGLNAETDVSGVVSSDDNGDPVLVAVIYPGAAEDPEHFDDEEGGDAE